MSNKLPDRRIIILVDLLFLVYVCLAFYHLAQKPFVPREYASFSTLQIDGAQVKSDDDIEFLISRKSVGDSIKIVTPTSGQQDISS